MKKLILFLSILPSLSYAAAASKDYEDNKIPNPILSGTSVHLHTEEAVRAFIREQALYAENPKKYARIVFLEKEIEHLLDLEENITLPTYREHNIRSKYHTMLSFVTSHTDPKDDKGKVADIRSRIYNLMYELEELKRS